MGTRGLPDIYTLSPRVYISGKPPVPMIYRILLFIRGEKVLRF